MHRLRPLAAIPLLVLLAACTQVGPQPPGQVVVSVSPSTAVLNLGESREFSASVTGAANQDVTWDATCGDIAGTGTPITYTAPSFETECVLTATSVAAPQASGSAAIEVRGPDVPEVTSNTDPSQHVALVELAAGETMRIRVVVPSGQRGDDRRLVVEVDDEGGSRQLDLVLYEPDGGAATASTSGTAFFRPGLEGIGDGFVGTAFGADAARPQRGGPETIDRYVSVVAECFGPCISRDAPTSLTHVYVEFTNAGSATEEVPLYAYTEAFIDEGETGNDTPAGAVDVSPTTGYRGAIEVLGDEDWVVFSATGTVSLSQREGFDLNIRMELYDAGGFLVETIRPGESVGVLAGDFGVIDHDPEQPQRASAYGFYDVHYE